MRVREALAASRIEGPRVWTAGAPLDFAGGHGGTVGAVEGNSPEEFGRLATEQVEAGVDLLKVMICDGGAGHDLERVRFSPEEFGAIRNVAREANLKMSLHTAAVPHPIMDQVIEDGVDSLEHCYLMPESVLKRCIDRGILLVMTPLVGRSPEYFEKIDLPRDMIDRLSTAGKTHWATICTAVHSGARLALGTDFHSHLDFGGTSAPVRELEAYEEAGADAKQDPGSSEQKRRCLAGMRRRDRPGRGGLPRRSARVGEKPDELRGCPFRDLRYVIAAGKVVEPRAPEEPEGA